MSEFDIHMQEALVQAQKAYDHNEIPIGAVVVDTSSNRVITAAYNQTETNCDPSAHAEVLAIRSAASLKNDWRLNDCALFVTVEPCTMCAGLILRTRIPIVVFGCEERQTGAVGSLYDVLTSNHVRVVKGILENDCRDLVQRFFKEKRKDV